MLKNLLLDLGQRLRRPKSGGESRSTDPIESWRDEFSRADGPRRQTLGLQLDDWIAAHPDRKQGWTLRGDWRLKLGDLPGAEQDFRRALLLDPLSPSAQEGIGLTLLQAGRLEEAYLHLESAHKLQPMNAEVLTHWGLVALEMGNLGDAHAKFERAVERDVRNPYAWHNLGLVALKQGRTADGIEHLRRAIELKPDHGLAHSNIALAYRDADRLDDALAAARRATELKADNARVWVVLGDLLTDAGELGEAEQSLQLASRLAPMSEGAWIALGKLYAASDRPADGLQAYRQALELVPNSAEAELGLGQLELLQRHFDTGWDLYEARKRTLARPVRSFPFIEWQGEDLTGRTLLVHAEQGLGDLILFSSCLPEVIERAGHVVVETYPRLASLFARSFPGATVIGRDTRDSSLDWLHGLPPVDRQIAIGSLPKLLRRDAASFPAHVGYLKADTVAVARARQRLAELGPGPKLGIAWRGGLVRSAGVQRSVSLGDLLAALKPLGVHLVSLQYGQVTENVEAASRACGVTLTHWPELLDNQDDAAALTCALDGVLTVCQTQAHLTGALGRPGCVLVPACPNWRYGTTANHTPWYPSLHLVRQGELDDWSDALQRACEWAAQTLPP
jgi:tetratricopeptide (TPR) repeat protein